RLHDRQIGGLFALEDAARVESDPSGIFYQARPVTHEPARPYEPTKRVQRRNRLAGCERNDPFYPVVEKHATSDNQRVGLRFDEARKSRLDFTVRVRFQSLNL